MELPTPTSRAKRRRLNFACNYCRSRKTRCDEQQPSCNACQVAGIPCVTVNRRRPGSEVERREAGQGDATRAIVLESAAQRVQHESPVSIESSSNSHQRHASHVESVSELDLPRATRFQGRLPIIHRRSARNSVEALADWLDLAMYRLGRPRVNAHILTGLASPRSVSFHIPGACPLPAGAVCSALVQRYFSTVHLIYPILQRENTLDLISFAQQYGLKRFGEKYGLAVLLQIYLVLALGAHSQEGSLSLDDLEEIEDYCKTLYGHIVSQPDIEAVRATILLALIFKYRGHENAALVMLTQSFSMATSAGIDGLPSPQDKLPFLNDLSANQKVWWSLYCFEKFLAFELGSASNPTQLRSNRDSVSSVIAEEQSEEGVAFAVIISLAEILGEICARCTQAGIREDNSSSPEDLQAAISAKVQTTGECCMLLSEWAESLPLGFRPTADILCNEHVDPLRDFVSIQYHNAFLMIGRNSLLINQEAIWEASETIAKGQPWEQFIHSGQVIVASSSRKILTNTIECTGHKLNPAMSRFSMALHASFVLYIHIIRHPQARMNIVDRILIDTAVQQLPSFRKGAGNDENVFLVALKAFKDMVNAASDTSAEENFAENIGSNTQNSTHNIRSPQIASTISRAIEVPEDEASWNQNDLVFSHAWSIEEPLMAHVQDQIGWDWSIFSQLFPTGGG